MTLECINPKDLPTPKTYTQVVVATGSKMVFVSGQEPEDIHGKLVGPGDLATQARQVFSNLGRALAAAGARPAQVTRITIYVVNYKRDECLPIDRPMCTHFESRSIVLSHDRPNVSIGVPTHTPRDLQAVKRLAHSAGTLNWGKEQLSFPCQNIGR
jgi:enamine deaminase RidA (YjgF/YER057c/UK114 family)